MSNVEMSKKLRGFFCTKCGSHECKAGFEEEQHPPCNKCDYFGFGADLDYTEAQLKQYGDDRAREALEMAEKPKPLNVIARNEINLELTVRQGFDGPDICYFIDLAIDAVEAAHGISKNTPAKEIK